MEVSLEFGRQVLASQPFSIYLGAELSLFNEGQVEIKLPIRPEFRQQHGFVHGGVLSYLADNALTFSGGSVLGPAVVTMEYKINYVKPANGDTLIARAEVISTSKRQAVCRADIFSVDGSDEILCATTLGTISRLGGSE